MLTEQRYEAILEMLNRDQFLPATTLAKRLYVSLPTIRRDLAELDRRGLILRTHGGAGSLKEGHFQLPLSLRTPVKAREKRLLCHEAAKLVKEGDIIFLDASTTVRPMADELKNIRHITVITNSIPLASLLCDRGVRTYCTGGEILEVSRGLAGSYAEQFISHFNIDIAFLSSFAISPSGTVADTSEGETALRRIVLRQAAKRIFLCDSEKFNRSAPFNLTPISSLDLLITNAIPPAAFGLSPDQICVVSEGEARR